MKPLSLRRTAALHLPWDGQAVVGLTPHTRVVVEVPVRLVALRREVLPPAPAPALRTALRLRAPRTFAALGPVAVDALLHAAHGGQVTAVLVALPQSVLEAIRAAVTAGGAVLAGVRVAELQVPVTVGGLVTAHGTRALVVRTVEGALLDLVPLSDEPGAEARERLRLGVPEDAPAGPALAPHLDFFTPTLTAAVPLLQRPGMRPVALAAGLAALLLLGAGLAVHDALAARDTALADEARYAPLAKVLGAQRKDLKEVARWFDDRPSLTPALAALAAALPAPGTSEQVRLVRLRQVPGEAALAEASAGDRAQMLAFLARLRADRRIAGAEIRAFRTPSKSSDEVVFELAITLRDLGGADAHA